MPNGILQTAGALGDAATNQEDLAMENNARRVVDNMRAKDSNKAAAGEIAGRALTAGIQTYKDYGSGKLDQNGGALHDFGQRLSGRDPNKDALIARLGAPPSAAASNPNTKGPVNDPTTPTTSNPQSLSVQPTVGITQDNAHVASAWINALHGTDQVEF